MAIFDFLRRRNKKQVEDEQQFRIEDRGYERLFKYGNITYSKLKWSGVYTREYWDYFIPVAYTTPTPKVLLIGLGGGTVAFQLTSLLKDKVDCDAIELSKRAVELSQKFIPRTKINVMLGEGSTYIETTNKKYDAIILDAYTSNKIPEQFLTKQFVENAHRALAHEGILAINYAMGLMGIKTYRQYVSKLKEKFHVYKVNTAMFEGNVIIICSKSLLKEDILTKIAENMQRNEDNAFLFENYNAMQEI